MEEIYKKLTEEVKTALETKEILETVAKTKASEDSGTFEVIISTADQDRQGEVVDQNGWDLSHFMKNPIVLWAHDYSSLPIGVADEVKLVNGNLTAKGRFAPEDANPFAQQVRRLYDAGIVRATSVGFIAKNMQKNVITESQLLEFSFVPVPANPYALSLRSAKEMGFDTEMLAMKGITFKAEGDTCTLEDGTDGTMQADPDGKLVCMPAPNDKETAQEVITTITNAIKTLQEAIAAYGPRAKGDEGEEHPADGDAPNERSNDAGTDTGEPNNEAKALNDWLTQRQLLRLINNVTSDALKKFNEKHRSK
ncbi:MAG: hypothetical protein NTX85_03250 [Candidatus Nomurabacteria bacterium]|nr:hypothetical protein [Candidatus Nomurabacteria bacterium]